MCSHPYVSRFASSSSTLLTDLGTALVILTRLLLSPFFPSERHKTYGRVLADISFRYSSSYIKVNQIQALLGTDEEVYQKWCKNAKVVPRIEELKDGGEGGALMWLNETKRNMDKVVLYLHGGCYCLPMQDFAAHYWKRIVDEANTRVIEGYTGLVALKYCTSNGIL